jgi:hypothetical protein
MFLLGMFVSSAVSPSRSSAAYCAKFMDCGGYANMQREPYAKDGWWIAPGLPINNVWIQFDHDKYLQMVQSVLTYYANLDAELPQAFLTNNPGAQFGFQWVSANVILDHPQNLSRSNIAAMATGITSLSGLPIQCRINGAVIYMAFNPQTLARPIHEAGAGRVRRGVSGG